MVKHLNRFLKKGKGFTYRHKRILVALFMIFAVLGLLLHNRSFQNSLLFPGISSHKTNGKLIQYEQTMRCKDGSIVSYLWSTKGAKNKKRLIFYFHPTGHNLLTVDDKYLPKGCSYETEHASKTFESILCAPDYPEHGHSSGTIKKEEDLWKYIDELVAKKIAEGYKEIIFYGHSLGTVVAIEMARKYQNCGAKVKLVLCSGFTSLKDVIRPYSWLMSWLCRYTFDNLSKIKQVRCPTLILHGRQDKFIAIEQSKKLHDACGGGATFVAFDGTHRDIPIKKIHERIKKFILSSR